MSPPLLLIFFLLCVSPSTSEKCFEVETETSWNKGFKGFLNVQAEEMATAWNVGICFTDGIQSFQAWKGKVARDANCFNITNKCYNGILYTSQCLSFDFIARHFYGSPLNITEVSFNGVSLPPCVDPLQCEVGNTTTEDSAEHSPSFPCYYLPECDSVNWCNFGYECCYENFCCPIQLGKPTCLPQEQVNSTLDSEGPILVVKEVTGLQHKVTQQPNTMNLYCPTGTLLYIKSALYTAPGSLGKGCTEQPVKDLIVARAKCSDKPFCSLPATDDEFGNPCPDIGKELSVYYACTGMNSFDEQEFQDFQHAAFISVDSEIANLTSSNVEEFKSSRGNCSAVTFPQCIIYAYRDYTECKISCGSNITCIIACVISKLDKHPKCKKCLKSLIKKMCCHFLPQSGCCEMTYGEIDATYNNNTTKVPICKTVAEFDELPMSCGSGTDVTVTYALFGRQQPPCGSAVASKQVVDNRCEGHQDCAVLASPTVFPPVKCSTPVLTICHICE